MAQNTKLAAAKRNLAALDKVIADKKLSPADHATALKHRAKQAAVVQYREKLPQQQPRSIA